MAEESTLQEGTVEQQPKIKMARWLQRVIGIIIPILFFLIARLITYLIINDYFTPWVSFGSPPAGAVSFIDTGWTDNGPKIFIRTQEKDVYKYNYHSDGKWALSSEDEIPSRHSDCEPVDTPFTRPPGKVVDEISTHGYCYPEDLNIRWGLGWMPHQYRFAILEDGTVWGWMSEPDNGQHIFFRFSGWTGSMLGGILWFMFQYFNRTIQPPPKQNFYLDYLTGFCSCFSIPFLYSVSCKI